MLITTDLHLTDRKADAYRWGLFPWLHELAIEYEEIVILGDITDAKDNHSAVLVNKIVASLKMLVGTGRRVYILKGNHDYIDEHRPYFDFLRYVPGISFFTEPAVVNIEGWECAFLPHTSQPRKAIKQFEDPDVLFMHQSVIGAQASNGFHMQTGVTPAAFKRFRTVLSGDIHVPQRCGRVQYVGTPYSVHFGDHFDASVISWQDGKRKRIKTPFLKRWTVEVPTMRRLEGWLFENVTPGDQVKVRIVSEHTVVGSDWRNMHKTARELCDTYEAELCGFEWKPHAKLPIRRKTSQRHEPETATDTEAVSMYGKRRDARKAVVQLGLELVEEQI